MVSGCHSHGASAREFLRDQRGAIAAEYVMLLALLATGISVSIFMLGDSIGGSFGSSSEVINAGGGTTETAGIPASTSSQTSSAAGCNNQGQGTGFGGGARRWRWPRCWSRRRQYLLSIIGRGPEMFQELMWLGLALAVVGILIVGYLASLAVRRAVDRRNEKQIVGQADYSRRLRPGDGGKS